MRILIDADGCPVVGIAVNAGSGAGIECIIICDTAHVYELEDAKTVTVSKGADSADFALVNMLEAGDIVVTQDYGLAAMALARKGIPLTHNGLIINELNIESLLEQRHISKKIRSAGGRLKGPSKRIPEQDKAFLSSLERLIQGSKDESDNFL
jgi:uncharacterized protein YaiI (UPF0178 family)